MKITIRNHEGKGFTIPLPTALLSNPTLVTFGLRISRKASASAPDLSAETVQSFCAAIKQVKRQYGTWELVHVESADGDIVSVIL